MRKGCQGVKITKNQKIPSVEPEIRSRQMITFCNHLPAPHVGDHDGCFHKIFLEKGRGRAEKDG